MNKKYTIELIELEDGKCRLTRTCDGFNALELLGLLYETSQDIVMQVRGDKPIYDEVKRQIVVKKENKNE